MTSLPEPMILAFTAVENPVWSITTMVERERLISGRKEEEEQEVGCCLGYGCFVCAFKYGEVVEKK